MKNKRFYFGVLAIVIVIFGAVIAVNNHRYHKNLLMKQTFYDLAATKQDTIVRFAFKDTSEFLCRIYPLETMTMWRTSDENRPYIVAYPEGTTIVALNVDWGIFESNGLLTSVIVDNNYKDKELAAIENSIKALMKEYKSLKVDFPELMADADDRQNILSGTYADLMDKAGYDYIAELAQAVHDWYAR